MIGLGLVVGQAWQRDPGALMSERRQSSATGPIDFHILQIDLAHTIAEIKTAEPFGELKIIGAKSIRGCLDWRHVARHLFKWLVEVRRSNHRVGALILACYYTHVVYCRYNTHYIDNMCIVAPPA